MCIQALQRTSEWHSSFGSTATAVICAFFDDGKNAKKYATDDARAEFAEYQIGGNLYRFIYKTADGNERKVSDVIVVLQALSLQFHQKFKGLFQGPFIAPVLAAHFTAITGACQIPGLYSENSIGPIAALALAVTAVCLQWLFLFIC